MEKKKSVFRKLTDKLFGGLNMSWTAVIVFAVCTAVLTAVFLLVKVFDETSFERMGVNLEAWIFFAVIIMANCKKPLESALKVFVFFLISQPLIYLIQVPFSSMGWGLFRYYTYWFILTLATFPVAYLGWYINKKNWLSLVILLPVIGYLTLMYVDGFREAAGNFPHLIVMALFCLGQVLLYLYAFTENIWQKLVGFILPLAIVVILSLVEPPLNIHTNRFLPDDPVLTENAVITVDDPDVAKITIGKTGENSMIWIDTTNLGTTAFTIKDGDKVYRYTVVIYKDKQGTVQIDITPVN